MLKQIMVLLSLLLISGPLWANEIAIVKKVEGDVKIKRASETTAASRSDKLQVGDILITGDDGFIGVIFHDGSVLALRENSFLRIEDFEFKPVENRFKFNLKLDKGAALFESGKIGNLAPEDFKLEIPEGSIGIRGTKFLVEVK